MDVRRHSNRLFLLLSLWLICFVLAVIIIVDAVVIFPDGVCLHNVILNRWHCCFSQWCLRLIYNGSVF